jgi:deoxyribodipyrimidine photo-lyase
LSTIDPQSPISVVWFRADLRVQDNPALAAALQSPRPCVALFIMPIQKPSLSKWELEVERPIYGGASFWWLKQSLERLKTQLLELNIPLVVLEGDEQTVVAKFRAVFLSSYFYWNRRYDAVGVAFDTELKSDLKLKDRLGGSFKGGVLNEPWEISNGSHEPYRVFTPYWKAVQKRPLEHMQVVKSDQNAIGQSAQKLNLSLPWHAFLNVQGFKVFSNLALKSKWTQKLDKFWHDESMNAQLFLQKFLESRLFRYKEDRNLPFLQSTSMLSAFMRFGEISPRQILKSVFEFEKVQSFSQLSENALFFLSEVCWREFSHTSLFYYKTIEKTPIKSAFSAFPWEDNQDHFLAWKQGNTGYPIVDAGMRELWNTGLMHNRVRMVVASFLVKHLRLPWTWGESWFWDTLVDACPANNPASWQWVAGCGLDAAPYFRIFNPTSQGERFDPKGEYVKKWLPELSRLGEKHIHTPWLAPASDLLKAGVVMGQNYPHPIVDHAAARVKALNGFQKIRGANVSPSQNETEK